MLDPPESVVSGELFVPVFYGIRIVTKYSAFKTGSNCGKEIYSGDKEA